MIKGFNTSLFLYIKCIVGGKYRILYTKKEKKEGGENGKCRYKIVSIKNDEKKIIIISKIIKK